MIIIMWREYCSVPAKLPIDMRFATYNTAYTHVADASYAANKIEFWKGAHDEFRLDTLASSDDEDDGMSWETNCQFCQRFLYFLLLKTA